MFDEDHISAELQRSKEIEQRRDHFSAIKAFYDAATPQIMAADPWRWAIEPSSIDWRSMFSPIEDAFWSDMREEGAVLYPQYPVAGFFVDFGHPKVKVAVECDGKQWHMDRQKDWKRDEVLRKHGWSVFRLSGRQCFETSEVRFDQVDGSDVEELGRPKLLLRAIGEKFGVIARYARVAA